MKKIIQKKNGLVVFTVHKNSNNTLDLKQKTNTIDKKNHKDGKL